MPEITQKELDKLKAKTGVYSTLNRPARPTTNKEESIKELTETLGPLVTQLVERAFKKYAKAHGCNSEMIETEWKRFNRFLQRYL